MYPPKQTAESPGPSQPAGGGEPRRSSPGALAPPWWRKRTYTRALGLLSVAGTCVAVGGVTAGPAGALVAAALVLSAGILLLISVPVTAFTRNQAALVKKAQEFATTVADICLIMDSHAAAFNVIFRARSAPRPPGHDLRPSRGRHHLQRSADGPLPRPSADGTPVPHAGSRRLSLTFWQLLTLSERQWLSAAARPVTFRAGTFICRQGERADHVLVVESGWTRVFTEHMDGTRVIAERGPGDLVGERAVLMIRRRSATVVALEDVRALLVSDESFTAFLHAYPRVNALLENEVYQRLTEDRDTADLTVQAASWIGQICPILLTDITAFGSPSRNDADRLLLRRLMYSLLPEAFEAVGLPWHDCYREDRGDGTLIIVPPHVPVAALLEDALDHLAAALRAHNEQATGALRMQLRVALHAGPVTRDDEGMAGHAINHTARLVQAKVLGRQLRETHADLGVIASEFFFDHVIKQHGGQPSAAASYQKVRFQSKESVLAAWIHLAGSRTDYALAD